jgi:peptidylprolyl isomerase
MRPLFVLSGLILATACSRVVEPDPPKADPSAKALGTQTAAAAVDGQPGELQKVDLVVGKGDEAKTGQTVKVHYTGTLVNGSKFDSSVDRGDPFKFTLGQGGVIQGWDQGIPGMRVGGKRKLTIPYNLAYGESGRPPTIPPKATLIFDVELLGIE